MDGDLDDLDFSFTCNKCTFTTKSILEIKVHSMVHKKDVANQKEKNNDLAPEKEIAAIRPVSPARLSEDASGMVDIPVGKVDGKDNMVELPIRTEYKEEVTEELNEVEKEVVKEVMVNDRDGIASNEIVGDKQGTEQVDSTEDGVQSENLPNNNSTTITVEEEKNRTGREEDDDEILVSIGKEVHVAKAKTEDENACMENSEIGMVDTSTQMVDMGTQMDLRKPGPGRPPKSGRGAARRKAKVPVREQVEEPEEADDDTTEEEEADIKDVDYEPPGSNRILDEVNDAMLGAKRGRRPLTRAKLKGLKVKGTAAYQTVIPNNRYKCIICEFGCKFKTQLQAHMKEVHNEDAVKKEEVSDEGDESDNENTLIEGITPLRRKSIGAIADDRYSCTICNEYKCKFKKDLARHKHVAHNIMTQQYKYVSRIATDRYKCMHCSYTCKFQRALRSHKRRVHPRPKPVSQMSSNNTALKTPSKPRIPLDRYKCGECDYTCKFKGLMKSHKSKQHRKERPTKKLIKELECEHCGKIIRGTQHHLIRHLKTHTGEKPWECDICGAVFAEKGRLNVHKPIHNETRPWLCEECGKSFKRAINLRMHRKIHVEVKPYQCQLCAYRCTRHDTLNLHMKRKHLKLRRVLCTFCGKKFFSEKECQAHTSRKHLPRPTPFQCTLCPAAFPFAYNLRAHMKKHPEHKPFKCEYCGFESRSKASLKDHERQHTDGPNPDPEHKPFKCGYCGFESRSKAYMKDHERQHTGEKEKKCDICDYATTTSSNLYKHRKRQHGILGMPAKQTKGRGRPPRANALLAAQVAAVAAARSHPSTTPPIAHQHPPHQPHQPAQPVTLTIAASDLVGQHRPQPSEDERTAESIEDGDVAAPLHHIYNKDRRPTVMYGREKSIIGSVITEALAEARNVVQSDIYAGHMIPTSMPSTSIGQSAHTTSTLQPLTVAHSASTFTMAHAALSHHGTVVNLAEGMLPTGIPVTAQGIPVSVAMQNVQPSGPATMFSSMMNMHY